MPKSDREIFVEVVQGMLVPHRIAVVEQMEKENPMGGRISTVMLCDYERRMLDRMFEEAKTSPGLKNYMGMAMMALRGMVK